MTARVCVVRSKQKVQDKVGPLEGSDGNMEGFLMAENLNEYFSSVFILVHYQIAKFEGRECDYLEN